MTQYPNEHNIIQLMDELRKQIPEKFKTKPEIFVTKKQILNNWKYGILPDPYIPKQLKESPQKMFDAIDKDEFYWCGSLVKWNDYIKSMKEFSSSMEIISVNITNLYSQLWKSKLPRKLKKKMFGTRSSRRRGRF